jgi:inhibitor of cysteine peptidase
MLFFKKEIKDNNESKLYATEKLKALDENIIYPEKLSPQQITAHIAPVKVSSFNYHRVIRYASALAVCFVFVMGIVLSLSVLKKADPSAFVDTKSGSSSSIEMITTSTISILSSSMQPSSVITSSKKPTSSKAVTPASSAPVITGVVTTAKNYDDVINAFKTIYKNNTIQYSNGVKSTASRVTAASATTGAEKSTAAQATTDGSVSGTSDYSTTNLQVDGVDEGDIVKNDGSYLYTLFNNKLNIADVRDPKNMKLVSTLTFDNSNAVDMYVYKNKLIVVTNQNPNYATKSAKAMPVHNYNNQTKVMVYDITDRSNPKEFRSFTQDGNFVSSRMIGNNIYVATSYYSYVNDTNNITAEEIVPKAGESTKQKMIPAANIFIPIEPQNASYAILSGINVEDTTVSASTVACVGSAGNVFASLNNLYLSSQRAYYRIAMGAPVTKGGAPTNNVKSGAMVASIYNETTDIIRFNLNGGKVAYTGTCTVDGNINNQFSMDEFNGYFRIATTTYSPDMKNNLYIFDSKMKLTGSIEDMAKGEKIYSVRFMNNRAYIVTFRTVDPLFVIDLTNPKAPKVLGELKIPGFSDYLQPYSDDLIIGFGKDAVESGNMAYYQGLKLSLFDVSDPLNPKETFSYHIGDRGSTSPVLNDHRALLFNKDKNIIGFPVTIMQLADGAKNDIYSYGSFKCDGYYVMGLDPSKGFNFKGSVTHLDSGNQNDLYSQGLQIQRGAYIGNVLYTISNAKIVASSLNDFSNKLGELSLPFNNGIVNGTTSGSVSGSAGGGVTTGPAQIK